MSRNYYLAHHLIIVVPTIDIPPEAIFFQHTNLICELSKTSFSYFFENDVQKRIHGVSVFKIKNTKDHISEELFSLFKNENLLNKAYKSVSIYFSDVDSTLLPQQFYHMAQNTWLINILCGDLSTGTILTDAMPAKNIYTVYRIPEAVYHVVKNQFPLANLMHQYSALVNDELHSSDLLKLIIYEEKIVVKLVKNKKIQIVQTYFNVTDADVLYYLLNICKQFNINDIALNISGAIKEDSDLIHLLKDNFSEVVFDKPPAEYELAEKIKAYPLHYFSHLFSLAS